MRYHEDEEDRFQWHDIYAVSDQGDLFLDEREPFGSKTNRLTEADAIATYAQNTMRRGRWQIAAGLRHEDIEIRRRDWGPRSAIRPA